MKKLLPLIVLLFTSYRIEAAWFTSMEDAQKEALSTHKLILVDFTAKWCGPCKQMDLNAWNDVQIQTILKDFVTLKIDVDVNRDIAFKYQIRLLPSIFIIDPNGKIIHQFTGYQTASDLKRELIQYSLSTEYLATELIGFYQTQKYNTAIRIAQKYYNYSLLVNNNIKGRIVRVANEYLKDAKDELKKSDENYLQKKQKLELLVLYELAYRFDFEKLNKKISAIKAEEINELNDYQYWFLKYLAIKGTQKDITETEQFLRDHNLENVIENSNQLFNFYERSLVKH
jgi:thioredoxin-like negative regulator of GroEL